MHYVLCWLLPSSALFSRYHATFIFCVILMAVLHWGYLFQAKKDVISIYQILNHDLWQLF